MKTSTQDVVLDIGNDKITIPINNIEKILRIKKVFTFPYLSVKGVVVHKGKIYAVLKGDIRKSKYAVLLKNPPYSAYIGLNIGRRYESKKTNVL